MTVYVIKNGFITPACFNSQWHQRLRTRDCSRWKQPKRIVGIGNISGSEIPAVQRRRACPRTFPAQKGKDFHIHCKNRLWNTCFAISSLVWIIELKNEELYWFFHFNTLNLWNPLFMNKAGYCQCFIIFIHLFPLLRLIFFGNRDVLKTREVWNHETYLIEREIFLISL